MQIIMRPCCLGLVHLYLIRVLERICYFIFHTRLIPGWQLSILWVRLRTKFWNMISLICVLEKGINFNPPLFQKFLEISLTTCTQISVVFSLVFDKGWWNEYDFSFQYFSELDLSFSANKDFKKNKSTLYIRLIPKLTVGLTYSSVEKTGV